MDLSLKVLGASSAIPLSGRSTSSQFLTISGRHFLIDCGEGTQIKLRQNGIGFGRINHILISHLHGDHFYGLLPLLSTLHLLDRHKELHLYGPPELERGVHDVLKLSHASLRFPINFHPLNMKERALIYEDDALCVYSFPLKHRIDCCGFLFTEKERPRNIRKEALAKYSIPVAEIRQIKKGMDWKNEDGKLIPNQELTMPPAKSLSYAYCTDTRPLKNLKDLLQIEPDLLYHEATFTKGHSKRARETYHSTAAQAAEVAESVGARHLLIGHFSVRYDDLNVLVDEARELFENTLPAKEDHEYLLSSAGELKVVS